jgi:hypothetical protein
MKHATSASLGSAVVCMSLTLSNAASAEKEEEPSLYVQPQTGVFLRIEESDKRGVARLAHKTPDGFRLDFTISAPLDDDSREAALANIDAPAPGASARLALGYDSRQPALRLTPAEVDIASESALCLVANGGFQAEPCQASEQDFRKWYSDYVAAGPRPPSCSAIHPISPHYRVRPVPRPRRSRRNERHFARPRKPTARTRKST